MGKNKIARICWNTEGWQKPSGPLGKSKSEKTYEGENGFGHEEWLLDTTKLIDGWHYSYLQPVALYRQKYIDQMFNISLYSINNETKKYWWIGRIKDVKVISKKESRKIYSIYKKNGWLKEMKGQLHDAGVDIEEFNNIKSQDFAVIKYRVKSMQILDPPQEFSSNDSAVPAKYYILLNKRKTPTLRTTTKKFSFSPGHKDKKNSAKSKYETQSTEIDLIQNRIQKNIFRQLVKVYGKRNVGTEQDTGFGSLVDLVVRDIDKKFIFFEIKTSYSVKLCIREALSQLLEYAFFPNVNNAKKLIIVSPNEITPDSKKYMRSIRKRFKIPIYYQKYDSEQKALENVEY